MGGERKFKMSKFKHVPVYMIKHVTSVRVINICGLLCGGPISNVTDMMLIIWTVSYGPYHMVPMT